MKQTWLNKKQWDKIRSFLKTQGRLIYIGNEEECQIFLEALIWMARSGAQWRLLPEKYGNWNHVYKRFSHWGKQGIFEKMNAFFAQDADLKNLMLDSTITRAHTCAAGALKKTAARISKRSDVLEAVSARKSTF
jgi:transposase